VTNATETITVRSLSQLSQLVAQHITKPFLPRAIARNPGIVPDYHTWAGMESVIRVMEDEGYRWDISGPVGGDYSVYIFSTDAVMFDGSPDYSGKAEQAPVAFCLAALASRGINVRLELG
jgi:hypothetical protein